ncbi:MAG TPA: sugar ABC transporter permease [Trebonia sp.]|jgi:multiple sugar transport system permease protein|nr:sugar ABC transporter permease [Trebonia sp.]
MASAHDVFRRRQARLGWGLSAPALVVIGAVTIFPIGYAIAMSVSNVSATGSGFSLNGFTGNNYSVIFHAAQWRYALFFTVFYTVVTVTIEVVLGTLIALVLERLAWGRGWMMALLLIPWSMITVINAQLWGYIYNPTYGVLDTIFSHIGLGTPVFFGTRAPAIASLMVADIWKTTPFVAIIVLAGLVMIPRDFYEAAEVDGATGWRIFWTITFPLLRPTIALAVLFRVLQAFGLFDLPFVLTSGGPGYSTQSLAILAYDAMFRDLDFGPGAAVATSTALLVVIGCVVFLKVFRSQAGSGAS